MKKATLPTVLLSFIFLIQFLLLAGKADAQDKGTLTDKRDGHVYTWVRIGKYTWLNENLNFITPAGSWFSNNDSSSADSFGRLYDWATAMTSCPKGWRLPSDEDWSQMVKSLGGDSIAGIKYQEMDSIGRDPGIIAKNPGFCSLFSGIRHADGSFSGTGLWGGYWSSTFPDPGNANNILFAHGSKEVGMSSNDKSTGFSVRCIKKK